MIKPLKTHNSAINTAGCDLVSPFGAIAIGVLSALVMMAGNYLLESKFKVDDAVGAIPVHGFCGVLGTILTGVFATTGGLLYGGGFHFLGVQVLGAVVIAIWGFVASYIAFVILKRTIGLRVTEEEEMKGLDLSEHGVSAYPGFKSDESDL